MSDPPFAVYKNCKDRFNLSYLYVIIFDIVAHQVNILLDFIRVLFTHHIVNVFIVVKSPIIDCKIVSIQ